MMCKQILEVFIDSELLKDGVRFTASVDENGIVEIKKVQIENETTKNKKWRPFQNGEMPAIYFTNGIYKSKTIIEHHDIWQRPIAFCPSGNKQIFIEQWETNENMFRKYKVSLDGGKTWQPIGVKEAK